ncbi:hypothetical protein V490_05271 [Pseudogymnoascus sp. VKM F-3557]|nr:hypothetical protein V490_05271 [Pseudogymnoascus sp. VKM F-3557]
MKLRTTDTTTVTPYDKHRDCLYFYSFLELLAFDFVENKMRPPEEERDSWYFGIDARMYAVSMLVARSSTDPFQKSYTEDTRGLDNRDPLKELKRKAMSTIGNRKIVTIYDDELRPRVREIQSDIKWKTIDVVRLGYIDEPSYPIILITVDINDVDENTSQDAVNKIHELMVEFHLPDIHAEIKTGRLFEQAKPGLYLDGARYGEYEHYPLELARVPKLGASVSSADSSLAGSLCLFLKINGSKYAMTCQHVVISSEKFTPTDARNIILLPAKKDLEHHKARFDWRIEANRLCCEELEAKKQKAGGKGSALILKDDEAKASIKLNCRFGTVEYAPGISKHPLTNSRRDWAVIKLNDDRFQTLPPNLLPPTHFTFVESDTITEIYGGSTILTNLMHHLGVTTTTVLPLQELNRVPNGSRPSEEDQDHESLLVFKHGSTSGWTAGSLNEIRSDCRFESGSQTMEYCVVNIPDLNFFSYQGDSGACVVDIDGRIVGMVHSGNGENVPYGAEITYLTPMEWIIQDIKDTLKTDDVVIEHLKKLRPFILLVVTINTAIIQSRYSDLSRGEEAKASPGSVYTIRPPNRTHPRFTTTEAQRPVPARGSARLHAGQGAALFDRATAVALPGDTSTCTVISGDLP